MAVLGVVFLVLIGIAVLAGVGIAVLSLPDLRKYRSMRRM